MGIAGRHRAVSALAGLFALLLTALVGLNQLSPGSSPGTGSSEEPVIVSISPDNTPDETVSALQYDAAGLPDVNISDLAQQMVDDCTAGNSEACRRLLDVLADECYEGLGNSCDVLYQVSPVGSDYETYGATCGGRVTQEHAGNCGQL